MDIIGNGVRGFWIKMSTFKVTWSTYWCPSIGYLWHRGTG